MIYKDLAVTLRQWRKENPIENGFAMSYEDWYDFRFCHSHQKATRGDEKWFARQIGGSTEGTGKQWWEPFSREVDIGDGFSGNILIPGTNNYDLKVTFRERSSIDAIGFQQYRPADPIAFYAALMGTGPKNYTLIIVPKDVALRMRLDKILKTGKLGSAHGTGLYDQMTTQEKMNVINEAVVTGKSCVIGFDVKKKSSKVDFELLMDKYRMKFDEVSNFINNYKKES
jgi:hypothetical protein